MTRPARVEIAATDTEALAARDGIVCVVVGGSGEMGPAAAAADKASGGAVGRLKASEGFDKMSAGDVREIAFPSGMAAESLMVLKLPKDADVDVARKGGAAVARGAGGAKALTLCLDDAAAEVLLGALLRRYAYTDQKGGEPAPEPGDIHVMAGDEASARDAARDFDAIAQGVFFTRDLVSDPANVLTTTSYAERLAALAEIGLEVEVLEEDRLGELGMGALLSVGQGSASPSKVVVMKWSGGGDEAPLALVGKGVVFDTGGISLKPSAGMEEMTMDMGGSAVVAGVMKTLALRKAKANVVGLVGLVENMPSGTATRPGDVVRSMKGDMIEVVNTDAEGRLVLADVMWYAQETYSPSAMIDLATLTGAAIVGLGHHNAALLATDDALSDAILSAAKAEGEGAWRLPLGKEYAEAIKSRIADVKNSGGRPAGTITAAEFLRRFVKEDSVPWAHLDIAGVASTSFESPLAPKGASGWGVRTLDRLIRDRYEG